MISKEDSNKLYLDVNDLSIGQKYTKVCLLHNFRAGISVLEKGYYTFYLKDCNSIIIEARKFDIEDFTSTGFDALYLKNKPVQVQFTAQEFGGRWSLLVTSIKLWDKEFDYSTFVGSIGNSERLQGLSTLYSNTLGEEITLPRSYATDSITALCQGRVGGALKVLDMVTYRVSTYSGLPTVNSKQLFKALLYSYKYYVEYLKSRDELDIISPAEEFVILQRLSSELRNDSVYEIVLDTVYALLGRSKPKHLYANIVTTEVTTALSMSDLCFVNQALVTGASTSVKGVELLRY